MGMFLNCPFNLSHQNKWNFKKLFQNWLKIGKKTCSASLRMIDHFLRSNLISLWTNWKNSPLESPVHFHMCKRSELIIWLRVSWSIAGFKHCFLCVCVCVFDHATLLTVSFVCISFELLCQTKHHRTLHMKIPIQSHHITSHRLALAFECILSIHIIMCW